MPRLRPRFAPDIDAYELMRGVGNLCIGADNDPGYDASPGRTAHHRPAPMGIAVRPDWPEGTPVR
jgi:hypothetical protein